MPAYPDLKITQSKDPIILKITHNRCLRGSFCGGLTSLFHNSSAISNADSSLGKMLELYRGYL